MPDVDCCRELDELVRKAGRVGNGIQPVTREETAVRTAANVRRVEVGIT